MKTYLQCIPCFVKQALRAGKMACNDEREVKALMDRIGCRIQDITLEQTPPEMGLIIYDEIHKITGIDDPYKDEKKAHIKEALRLYPALKKRLTISSDPLMMAIRIAIAGNVMDLGMDKKFHIEKDLEHILERDFAICDIREFKESLDKAKNILYLGDNAGESVFDKILIETLGKPVTYVVRGRAIINDVIKQDAIDSGLDEVAEIISSGSPAPATILRLCNDEFIERFKQADMIISKGQGNYEGLSDTDRPVFFLLKAKCPVIAGDIGVSEDDIVLKYAKKI
ncbi:MAG: ARMT1-like domain-containing protein [Candidatus Marinimicrobia bacterium]|nr:ARMT1-like domain-containing protein [Candidatus Neomarinimicrobiota bacterium]